MDDASFDKVFQSKIEIVSFRPLGNSAPCNDNPNVRFCAQSGH